MSLLSADVAGVCGVGCHCHCRRLLLMHVACRLMPVGAAGGDCALSLLSLVLLVSGVSFAAHVGCCGYRGGA
jgi:hypothetical protein